MSYASMPKRKTICLFFDLVVVYFFSENQALLDISNYLLLDFGKIVSLDQYFYLVKGIWGKPYLIVAGKMLYSIPN